MVTLLRFLDSNPANVSRLLWFRQVLNWHWALHIWSNDQDIQGSYNQTIIFGDVVLQGSQYKNIGYLRYLPKQCVCISTLEEAIVSQKQSPEKKEHQHKSS